LLGEIFWGGGLWLFLDLQNAEADIALFKGVPGAILGVLGTVLIIDAKSLPVEWWRLWRARALKMPPSNSMTWWALTTVVGKGTLTAAILLCLLEGIGMGYCFIYIAIESFFDKAGTMATYIGDGSLLDLWPLKYYFVIAVPIMMLALIFAKPWPRGARFLAGLVIELSPW
jgi:hypothetical protein